MRESRIESTLNRECARHRSDAIGYTQVNDAAKYVQPGTT